VFDVSNRLPPGTHSPKRGRKIQRQRSTLTPQELSISDLVFESPLATREDLTLSNAIFRTWPNAINGLRDDRHTSLDFAETMSTL
jgi:hypothetical protein